MSKKKRHARPSNLTDVTIKPNVTSAAKRVIPISIHQLPIDQLFVEGEFQRDLRPNKVRAIVSDFDTKQVNPAKVHKEPKGFSVLDGQHTTEALRILGYTHAPCIVFEGMSEQEKARMFRKQDDNKNRMASYDRFKAATVEGEETSVALKNALERAGMPKNRISATCVLMKLSAMFEQDDLVQGLRLIVSTWKDDAPSTRGEILAGMMELVRYCRLNGHEIPEAKFAMRIGRKNQTDLMAQFTREYPTLRLRHDCVSIDVREAMRKFLTRTYNNQLQNDRLPLE